MIFQVREFKEAFGFFNSQNSRDTELTVDEIFDVIAKFETAQPGKEVLPKVRRSPSQPLEPARRPRNALPLPLTQTGAGWGRRRWRR